MMLCLLQQRFSKQFKRLHGAISDYNKAIELDPNDADAY